MQHHIGQCLLGNPDQGKFGIAAHCRSEAREIDPHLPLPRYPLGGAVEFGEQIARGKGRRSTVGSQRVHHRTGCGQGHDPGVEDPNEAIRQALTPAGQEAYGRALVGYLPDPTSADEPEGEGEGEGEDYGDFVPGCYQQTSGFTSSTAFETDPIWVEFLADRDSLDAGLAQNNQLIELNTQWADCLADAGWPGLEQPQDAYELAGEEWSTWANDPANAGALPSGADLEAMQQREVSIAVADLTCQDDLAYEAARRAIQDPLEQAFVDARAEDIAYLQMIHSDADNAANLP